MRRLLALALLAGCADDARPRQDPDLPADGAVADAAAPDAAPAPTCCPAGGACPGSAAPCAPECAAPPDRAPGIEPESPPHPPEVSRSTTIGRVVAVDADRLEVEAGPHRFSWRVALPPGWALPLAPGEDVEVRAWFDDGDRRVEITAGDGPRVAFVNARASAPVDVFGLTLAVVDAGCAPNVIGDCLLSRNGVAAVRGAGAEVAVPQGAVAAHVPDADGARYTVVVAVAIFDENACLPPETHGPVVAAFVLRER